MSLETALHRMAHHKDASLTDIALECGFSSSSDFSRSFRAQFGVPPSAFDLDKDIAWDRLGEPGVYFPASYLRSCGIDPAVFDANPAAAELMQWALALAVCYTFVDLEENILFVAGRYPFASGRP